MWLTFLFHLLSWKPPLRSSSPEDGSTDGWNTGWSKKILCPGVGGWVGACEEEEEEEEDFSWSRLNDGRRVLATRPDMLYSRLTDEEKVLRYYVATRPDTSPFQA